MVLDRAALKRYLPHREPMLLLDEIKNYQPGKTLTAEKNITESDFYPWNAGAGLPGYVYPTSLLVESFGQAAAVLFVLTNGEIDFNEKMFFLGAISKIELSGDVYVGNTVYFNVAIDKIIEETVIVSGEILVEGRVVATVKSATLGIRPAFMLIKL